MRLHRFFAHVVAISFVLAMFVSPRVALAQNAKVEKEARALQKKAMEEDYLGTEFAAAQQKLDKAINACGTDKCSAQQRAQLRRDLGVVLIGGQIDKDKGQAAFIEAFKLDPAVTLDPDLKTKELEAAFEAARKKASGAPGETKSAGGTTASGGAVAGDFTHTPVTEGKIRTPVPVYVEYAGSENIVKVLVRYKGFGMSEFKPLELKKTGTGWGGYVPCGDVQQGNLQYYVQGFNDQNDPVATAGDRNNTYKVAIKREIAGQPAALPGQPAPTQCLDAGDCPPGFPCQKELVGQKSGGGKDEGAECDESSECKSNECKANKCTAPSEEESSKSDQPKYWLGVSVTYGFTLLKQGSDVCKLDGNPTSSTYLQPLSSPAYYCMDGGNDYPSRAPGSDQNGNLQTGKAGSIDGGFSPGNFRALVTFDYSLRPNYMVGLRLGVVAGNTYPGAEAQKDAKANDVLSHFHAEARFSYLFGAKPLEQTTGYLFLGGGVSQFTGSVDVPVAETNANGQKTVTAYLIGGPAFVTFGGGARIVTSKKSAILIGPRIDLAIGYVGVMPVFGLEAGFQFGLGGKSASATASNQ